MEELLKKYKDKKELIDYYNYALFIIGFDEATDCPKKDKQRSLQVQDFFQKKITDIITSEEYKKMICELFIHKEELDDVTRLDIEIEYKNMKKMEKIPLDELYAHFENLSRSSYEWAIARDTLDYSKFLKELKENVEFNKKYIKWQQNDKIKGFDVLLDEMEEGYNQKMYDEFFDVIENELVPFVEKILKCPKKYNSKLDNLTFDIDKQKKLTKIIAEKMGYTDQVGCIRETIHPFTDWANSNDVRITTSYDEKLLLSNLYSVMHEIGHALFQIHMDPKYNGTNIYNNVTCATHESQSRFYENYLGRSRAFVKFLYPILVELFPSEFEGIVEDDVYYYINSVEAQFKRTEADELTYPLHVLIRYKVEKKLFNGEIEVEQMEETFNYYMNKYLHITPSNMKEGVFQDSHWSSGFGYFPTYALGSAYGAQFYAQMKKDIDVDGYLEKGDFSPINEWLTKNIHQYSGTKKNLKIINDVCHEDFNPKEYTKYLIDKFTKIYLN